MIILSTCWLTLSFSSASCPFLVAHHAWIDLIAVDCILLSVPYLDVVHDCPHNDLFRNVLVVTLACFCSVDNLL